MILQSKWRNGALALVAVCGAIATALPAQTFKTLHSFSGADGEYPAQGLMQATNGYLYGTTYEGGIYNEGTVFRITTSGKLTSLYSFCAQSNCPDGNDPSGLIQATNGNFYGTTYNGGVHNEGTVFEMSASGALTTMYSFCAQSDCTDGAAPGPSEGLVQATNGSFYGTTSVGVVGGLAGTVFRITPGGKLTTLYAFCAQSGCPDGEYANAGLIQATDGNFYGTTDGGGVYGNYGTIFKITQSGKLTTLYSFCAQAGCTDGVYPVAGVIQGSDGNFYGTTYGNPPSQYGTVFKITPSGTLTTLYTFCAQSKCADGASPWAGLIQATDGNFYGTTAGGGAKGDGTIFKITPGGTLTTLYSFCAKSGCTDGMTPYGALVQDTDGTFYGTTYNGGVHKLGTVFSLSVGLGPFVTTLPMSAKLGAAVKILGTNLTGATMVTFNGTPAAFTVVSSSEVTTTVPAGATSGTVEVVTPGRTLASSVPFHVLP